MDLDAILKKVEAWGPRIEAAEKALAGIDPNLLQQAIEAGKALDPELMAKVGPLVEEVGSLVGEVKTVADQVSGFAGQLDLLAQRVSALENGKPVEVGGQMGQGEVHAGTGTASGEAKVGG